MADKNEAFLKKLLATFRVEADEHLQAMFGGLQELEQGPDAVQQAAIIERVLREAHSFKGAARAVNLSQIESVCQALESVFVELKDNNVAISRSLLDLLQEALDNLGTLLSAEGAGVAAAGKSTFEALVKRIHGALTGAPAARAAGAELAPQPDCAVPSAVHEQPVEADPAVLSALAEAAVAPAVRPSAQPASLSETVRVSTAKLVAVMRQTEELLPAKLSCAQRVADLRALGAVLTARKKQRISFQPLLRAVERTHRKSAVGKGAAGMQQEISRLLEYLEDDKLLLKQLGSQVAAMKKSAEHDQRTLSGMVDSLLLDVREMLMLPFSSLLEMFPHLIRELARDQGKQIDLTMQGGHLEIDRRILEEIKDPFIHLLRNCVDHGIEKPQARSASQKTPGGAIGITIAQKDGDKIEIIVADDGAGIDVGKLKAAAIRLGRVTVEEADRLAERELLELVFQSGVSTSHLITDLSGRGLGLAIVREKIERLGGTIEIRTLAGSGTTFRIVLPLTLATFRGVLVRAGAQLFVLPQHNVECVLRVPAQDIRSVENRATISFGQQALALARLDEVLELSGQGATEAADGNIQAAILTLGVERIAFQVDEVLGEQEVLLKMLGRQLARVRNVAGVCALGTGQVVPVLNVADLLKSAMRQTPVRHAPAAPGKEALPQRAILVAEDSITSRTLLKNILESAGYSVATAVDGLDAYTTLKTGTFHLVVSDVDMPRMNGFDLTAKIRSDKQFAELPVVLVTALGTREHRERGIDAGANAYIVKSSFDQSKLLDVIRQLI